mgnify:CR=1 FL=1|jgi:hypothetical protein
MTVKQVTLGITLLAVVCWLGAPAALSNVETTSASSNAANAECQSVISSWISQICYSSTTVTMATIKGGTYSFCGMSRATFDAWVSATSVGSYYNSNIKGRYQCF